MDNPDKILQKFPANKKAFLVAFAECGNISKACQAAGISRFCYYTWMKDDTFKPFAEAAKECYGDLLVAEADRRARIGWDEPVFHNGEVVGEKRKYSDTLMIVMLKMAGLFVDKQEVTGKQILVIDPNVPDTLNKGFRVET